MLHTHTHTLIHTMYTLNTCIHKYTLHVYAHPPSSTTVMCLPGICLLLLRHVALSSPAGHADADAPDVGS